MKLFLKALLAVQIVLLASMLQGCSGDQNDTGAPTDTEIATEKENSLKEPSFDFSVENAVTGEEIEYLMGDKKGKIHLVKFQKESFAARVAEAEYQTPKSVSQWAKECGHCVVINGAYFNEDHTAPGFVVIDGERASLGVFDQDKSGLVLINDNEISIRDLDIEPLKASNTGLGEKMDYALQSYPFLVKEGKAAVKEDSGLIARRSAIGVDENGDVLLFLSNRGNLSLYEFAKVLEQMELGIQTAINLDGGPSSGMVYADGENKQGVDSFVSVPTVIEFTFS